MTDSMTAGLRKAASWSIVLSVLMIVAGLFAIGAPLVAGIAVTAVVGWMLIFSGVLHLVFGWRVGAGAAVVWEILLGLLYGAIGIYLLARPVAGLASLTLALAFYLILEGVLELAFSVQRRPAPGSGWLIVDGIIALILAVMIWSTWPSSAEWAVGTLIGLSMLFSGLSRLMLSMAVRRAIA